MFLSQKWATAWAQMRLSVVATGERANRIWREDFRAENKEHK